MSEDTSTPESAREFLLATLNDSFAYWETRIQTLNVRIIRHREKRLHEEHMHHLQQQRVEAVEQMLKVGQMISAFSEESSAGLFIPGHAAQ